jgi:hypothetical protein
MCKSGASELLYVKWRCKPPRRLGFVLDRARYCDHGNTGLNPVKVASYRQDATSIRLARFLLRHDCIRQLLEKCVTD